MFRHSSAAQMRSDVAQMANRMQALERRLGRIGAGAANGASANFSRTADTVGDAVASALSTISDQFRGARTMFGEDASKFGQDAAKFGNDAMKRLTQEVEHRPLVLLAVAAGIGFLVGVARR